MDYLPTIFFTLSIYFLYSPLRNLTHFEIIIDFGEHLEGVIFRQNATKLFFLFVLFLYPIVH